MNALLSFHNDWLWHLLDEEKERSESKSERKSSHCIFVSLGVADKGQQYE